MNHYALAGDPVGLATIAMGFLMKQSMAMGPVYSGTSNKGPLRKGQPPYKGHSSRSIYHSINTFLTSEEDNLRDKDRGCVPKSEVPLYLMSGDMS